MGNLWYSSRKTFALQKGVDMITKDQVLDLLKKLVSIRSPYFHETEIARFVSGWLDERGIVNFIHEFHEAKVTNFYGNNVIVDIVGDRPGKHIYFNAHLDTVNEPMGWTKDPYDLTIEEDRAYGLGALDMKSGVTAVLLALGSFIKKNGKDFAGRITCHFVSDEEGPYGLGTTFLIEEDRIGKPDIAIITEPSAAFSEEAHPCICLGARGGYNYKIKFFGVSSHAATPDKGVSALIDAAKAALAIEDLELLEDPDLKKGSSVVIRLSSGKDACSVPDRAELEVFRHTVRGESQETIFEEIRSALSKIAIRSRYEIEFREAATPSFDGGFIPYFYPNEGLIREFVDSIEETTGKVISESFFSSIGDFNHIGGMLGIPTVIFGANGRNFHSMDEYVEIETVVDVANSIEHFLNKVLCIGCTTI